MKKNNKGFTLVELLVAMAILAVLLTAFGRLYIQSMQTHKGSSQQMDVNSRLRHLQKTFAQDLQELGFGEKLIEERTAIHPLDIIENISLKQYSFMVPKAVTHLKETANKGSASVIVFDSVDINVNDMAALIASDSATKVDISSVSGDRIGLSNYLPFEYKVNSRLVTYNNIVYVWLKDSKILKRFYASHEYTWEDITSFNVVFYNSQGQVIANPANPLSALDLSYALTEIIIDDGKIAKANFRTPLLNIQSSKTSED